MGLAQKAIRNPSKSRHEKRPPLAPSRWRLCVRAQLVPLALRPDERVQHMERVRRHAYQGQPHHHHHGSALHHVSSKLSIYRVRQQKPDTQNFISRKAF